MYIVKALVDHQLGCERGDFNKPATSTKALQIDLRSSALSSAMKKGVEELSKAASFRMFPVFWQVFLWGWGGFLLKDRLDEEYADLERETGVPVDEISIALSVFDKLFPLPGGWFKEPSNDSRSIMTLMPAAMRGIGAFRRKIRLGKEYKDLGFKDETTTRLIIDNNTSARLLDSNEIDLVK